MVLQRIDSAAAANLPEMVAYLIRHATQTTARQVSLVCCISFNCKACFAALNGTPLALQVAQMMRQKLKFAISADPRSAGMAQPQSLPYLNTFLSTLLRGTLRHAAADPLARDKGMACAESPSLQTLQALKAGLQVSPLSCEAFLAEIHGADGAIWLLALHLVVILTSVHHQQELIATWCSPYMQKQRNTSPWTCWCW